MSESSHLLQGHGSLQCTWVISGWCKWVYFLLQVVHTCLKKPGYFCILYVLALGLTLSANSANSKVLHIQGDINAKIVTTCHSCYALKKSWALSPKAAHRDQEESDWPQRRQTIGVRLATSHASSPVIMQTIAHSGVSVRVQVVFPLGEKSWVTYVLGMFI